MSTITNNRTTNPPSTTAVALAAMKIAHQASVRQEALAAFHAHLIRSFKMPARLALARVNADLAANPLTCGMQLQASAADLATADLAVLASHQPIRRKHRPYRFGFTLVELLVVIGIIAMLISILLPTLGRARRAANEVTCASNVRQLAVAMQTYCDANKGYTMPIVFEQGEYWHHKLAFQLGDRQYASDPNNPARLMYKLMRCPETDSTEPTGWGSAYQRWVYGDGSGSYGLNLWLLPNGLYAGQFPMTKAYAKLTSVKSSSEVPVVADSIWVGGWPDNDDVVLPNVKTGWGQHANGYFMGRFCIDRHRHAINVGFVDGHVSRVELADLWKLKWHKQSAPKDVVIKY